MIDRFFDRATRAIELALAILFIFAVLLNFTNVIGRYVFSQSILWADEIQIFIMIAITFLGAVVVTWRRQHLRMDVLVQMMPPAARKLLHAVELVLMLGLCLFVMVQSQDYAMRMHGIGKTSDTAGIAMWIPHGSVALGFALIVVVCFWNLCAGVRDGFPLPDTAGPGQTQEEAR